MKVIIIDDERLARKELSSLLAKYEDIDVVWEGSNADEGIALIEEHSPDVVFLDINMPGRNGFEMLEELSAVPKVIFVTAYDDYAIQAFEVNALDYLLKPVDPDRMDDAIRKLREQDDGGEEIQEVPSNDSVRLTATDQIFIKDGEKCWFVTLKDVRMFESEGNYVRVYFEDFKPLILKSLNNLETRLDQRTFFRTNRKFIINLKWVESIENWFNGGLLVKLKGGEKVEISRRQASRFKDLMSL